jgi:Ras-related protein Rab-1A
MELIDDETADEYTPDSKLPKKITEFVPRFDYILRICIIGDAAVGKTSLLTRYCDNVFKENYTNTIGVDFRVVSLKYKDMAVKIQVWDTAGQERFKSISVNYFRSAHGFIFVYDVTNKTSFYNIEQWIQLAFANNKTSEVNFLVGNKIDLDNRVISSEQGKSFANLNGMNYLETSALANEKVSDLFELFSYRLIEFYSKNKKAYESSGKQEKLSLEASDINFKKLQKKSSCLC